MKRIAAYFKSPLLFITLLDGFADAAFGLILLVYISQLAAPYWLTILSIAGFLAGMSFGPLTGWVADRYSGRACWVGSLVFSALCVVAIGAFADPVVIVVASTLNGIASGLTNAAEFKLLPKAPGMTPSTASAYIVGIGSLCAIIAPPIGAFFATFNMRATIFCCAGLYFLASVIARVKVPPGRPEITIGRDSLKDVFLGFSALKSSRAIAVFLPVLTLVVVATSMEGISGVFYLQSITSTFGFSAILAMWAVGTFIASVCYGRGIWRPNIVVCLIWGGFFIGAAILLEALVPNPWVVGAGFLVGGFFNSIHNIGIRDLIYTQVPEERQGQAWSMVGAYFGSLVMLGDLLGTPGIYADARTIVTISGTVSVTVAAANLGLYALVRKCLRGLLAVPGEGIYEI